MNVQIGTLHRRRSVRKMSGEIIDMSDETDGSGVIIRKGQVVNQKKVDEMIKKEEDKKLAGKAEALQVSSPEAPDRTAPPSKVLELEKRVEGMEGNIAEILKILTKKK